MLTLPFSQHKDQDFYDLTGMVAFASDGGQANISSHVANPVLATAATVIIPLADIALFH